MNMKKGLICLLIVAMLTLCVPNVAAAQASKQTDEVHGGYKLDATVGGQPTLLSLMLNHNVTAVNKSFDLFGGLTTSTSSGINHIEGATINIQRLNSDDGTWYTKGTLTTMSGNFSGFFMVHITPRDPGEYIYRATYDGDSNYAPAVSNVVALTVTNMVIS